MFRGWVLVLAWVATVVAALSFLGEAACGERAPDADGTPRCSPHFPQEAAFVGAIVLGALIAVAVRNNEVASTASVFLLILAWARTNPIAAVTGFLLLASALLQAVGRRSSRVARPRPVPRRTRVPRLESRAGAAQARGYKP